jgi:hypothetical protein
MSPALKSCEGNWALDLPSGAGERLANKSNYPVPGLSELVEIHVQWLGQTMEARYRFRKSLLMPRVPPRGFISAAASCAYQSSLPPVYMGHN